MEHFSVPEAFSPGNTAHLVTENEKRKHLENTIQMAWFSRQADMSEQEFDERAQWFREVFLMTEEAERLLNQFQENSEGVLNTMEEQYLSSVTKH